MISASIDGLRDAERLDVDLVELAVAALLRPLAPEHRAQRVDLQRGSVFIRLCSITARTMPAVASGRSVSDDAVAVVEGVHLLRDDVGLRADAAREQLRLLEDRRADLAVAVAREELRGRPPRRGARPRPRRAGCPACP